MKVAIFGGKFKIQIISTQYNKQDPQPFGMKMIL